MQLSNDFDLSLILVYIDLTFRKFEILTQKTSPNFQLWIIIIDQ